MTAIHHGLDREAFFRDHTPLDAMVQQRLESDRQSDKDVLRLLYVSHYYYYYRNFETLFRALPLLRERLGGRKVKLFLTCRLRSEENPGTYRANAAASLVTQLGIAEGIRRLQHLCDARLRGIICASLVEAMASGLPIVAADTGVHREICQDAAVYFPRFSPEELAERVCQISASDQLARKLADRGLERLREFSWDRHVDELLNLAGNLLATIDPAKGCESSAGTRYKAS